ncbi:MAG: hypothetical protein ACREC0_07485 [Methylocella sp.]
MAEPTERLPRGLLSKLVICSAAVLVTIAVCAPALAVSTASAQSITYVADAASLVAAYPDFIERIEGNDLVWKDGDRMPIWDGKGQKDFATLRTARHKRYVPVAVCDRPAQSAANTE